jgi:uncharacterized protein YndB with AHSA1/START domain
MLAWLWAASAGAQAPIENRIDTLPSGELMLVQSTLLEAPLEKAWAAYTEPEAWKQWVTPVVEMDFRINGSIRSHYDLGASIGSPGTVVIHVLNYIPMEQITMQAELAENFPEFMRGEEKNLYSIVRFEPRGKSQTLVTLYGIGYPNEDRWRDLMQFFVQGNEQTLRKLQQFLEGE